LNVVEFEVVIIGLKRCNTVLERELIFERC